MPDVTHQHYQTQDKGTVLVFGATGKQGGAVAAALKTRGWTVRAFVRNTDTDSAKRLASNGVTLHGGDFSNVDAIRAAMEGVHGVFSMQPNSGSPGSGITDADEVRFGKSIADIAVESGVRHLVYSSAGIISRGPTGLANLDTKIEIENHIRDLDIKSTIIRPGTFMDLFTLPGMGLDRGEFLFFTQPTRSFQAIAVEDIGNIAAKIFSDLDRYVGKTIEIAGDELTGLELAQYLTEAAGRPIVYRRFSEEFLENNEFLKRNTELFDEGRGSRNADVAALEREFGKLLSVPEWLASSGAEPLLASLH